MMLSKKLPSAYDMYAQVHNEKIVNFIKQKNKETKYTVSNCAGAQLIGESGIANGHKIVTWIGGREQLQKDYPELKVQNDSLVTYVKDGKFCFFAPTVGTKGKSSLTLLVRYTMCSVMLAPLAHSIRCGTTGVP